MLTDKICPKCGKAMISKVGLDGLFCIDNKCGYYDPNPTLDISELAQLDMQSVFNEENLKPLRGVPMNIFIIGSEAKGRVQVQIPCNCDKSTRRKLIDEAISDLKYLKNRIDEEHLDIYSSRGKKE